ncbi:MAG: zinc metallopeptidase [Thiohalocapsa sp.]
MAVSSLAPFVTMHPAVLLIPILAAAFGPRLWANRLLRRHDVVDNSLLPANLLARQMLDRKDLFLVRVELTDLGDHYDPLAKAVRLSRARFERRSLTAATTAAHEVGHALQDAEAYWPFRLHLRLARVSRVSGDVGTVLLIAVPVAAMIAQGTMPALVGIAAAGMLATSLFAQLAALPSELNASFGRALPLLRDSCMDDGQRRDAGVILLACSLTYVSSSLNPLMVLWPWIGSPLRRALPARRADRPMGTVRASRAVNRAAGVVSGQESTSAPAWSLAEGAARNQSAWRALPRQPRHRLRPALDRSLIKAVARPWIRGWLRLTGDY